MKEKGPETVASYEDSPIRTSYRQHVLAAGAYPAQFDQRADLVLGIYTPVTGVTVGADTASNIDTLDGPGRFLKRTREYVLQEPTQGWRILPSATGAATPW